MNDYRERFGAEDWTPARYDCGGCRRCVRGRRNTALARNDWHRERADRRLALAIALALVCAVAAIAATIARKVAGA
jgi:hypothetical protein